MGLDSYIEPAPKAIKRKLNLCGGLFSGDGNTHTDEETGETFASFRGKAYADLVLGLANVSLYQDPVPPEELQAAATALNAALDENPDQQVWTPSVLAQDGIGKHWDIVYDFQTDRQEVEDLAELLTAAADEGCTLSGWW